MEDFTAVALAESLRGHGHPRHPNNLFPRLQGGVHEAEFACG